MSSGVTLKKEIMAGAIYSKTLYDYIVIGECVPNATMAGVIKEEMLTKVSGKGYSEQVVALNIQIKCLFPSENSKPSLKCFISIFFDRAS